jgi:diacylglycerol kinase family enzyme
VRVLLVVNTTASAVTLRGRVVIQKALSADHEVEVAETSRRGHAERLARGAANDGVEVVVVMGGDGTLNEAANGLAGTATALAPLHGGSTNVFARTIRVPADPVDATGALLASLARGSFRRIGLGSVEGRHFLFHTGIGFDAAVVEQVERRSPLKRYAGHPLFVTSAFLTWFSRYDRTRPRFEIELDDGEVIDGCYFAVVSNTSPYTYLHQRPVVLAPDATLDAPLTLTAFRTLRFSTIMGTAGSALLSGRFIRRHPRIANRSSLVGLTVRDATPFPYQVDGDFLGDVTRLRFAWHPAALTVVMP